MKSIDKKNKILKTALVVTTFAMLFCILLFALQLKVNTELREEIISYKTRTSLPARENLQERNYILQAGYEICMRELRICQRRR